MFPASIKPAARTFSVLFIRTVAAAVGLALAASLVASMAQAGELALKIPVEKFKLPNGLTVLLMEDHAVPMISFHTWYKVGSRDEKEGITGSAHMLEHMMFQGAKKYTGKQFHHLMEENGIDFNAFTSNDYTGFYMNLPTAKLELVMDAEVDRMSSLAIDPKNLQSEREVVKEERRWRVDNSQFGRMNELTMSTVFRSSPYHWPVIGWMKDIEHFTSEGLRKFYETYYVPANAVLVVAGDIEPARVRKLVESKYGVLPLKEVPSRAPATEAPQKSQRSASIHKDVQAMSFEIAYQGVPEHADDMYALELASVALGSGSSSRLYRRLVYQSQVASGVSVSNTNFQDAGLFTVGVTMKPGLPMDPAFKIIASEIAKLRRTPLTDEEMRKVRTLKVKTYVDDLQTIESKARSLAAAEIVTGSYENLLRDMDRYEQVTAADIQRVANKYFVPQNRSLIVLDPSSPVPAAAAALTSAGKPAAPAAEATKEEVTK